VISSSFLGWVFESIQMERKVLINATRHDNDGEDEVVCNGITIVAPCPHLKM
jgi:ribosomal protein RSM22 (predicted rRNA methylase)